MDGNFTSSLNVAMKGNIENTGTEESQTKNLKDELKQRNISFEEKKTESSSIISLNPLPDNHQGRQNPSLPNDQKGK